MAVIDKLELPGANKSRAGHLPLVGLALCFGLVLILYWPVLVSLVRDWFQNPDVSLGFVVVPVSLYLVWQRREKLKAPHSPSKWGLLVLALGLLLFLLGEITAESFTQRVSLLIVITGVILLLLGKKHLRTVAFPLAFLILMIPIPALVLQQITFPMQLFASRCSATVLDYFGIAAIREGNVIYLPNVTLNVAQACSGIRSLLSFLTIGTLIAYFTNKVLWQRLLVIFATVPVAIFLNVFRISLTAFLSYNFGPKAAEGIFHESIGIILFLAASVLFYGFSSILARLNFGSPPRD